MKKYVFLLSIFFLFIFSCKKNEPPYIPSKPYGIEKGKPNITYYFFTTANDPEKEEIAYQFDWGDGNKSHWSKFYPSGKECDSMGHKFSKEDTYYVMARAKDIHNNVSDWSVPCTVIIIAPTQPPSIPTIVSAPCSAYVLRVIKIKVTSVDPENNNIKYICDWGDNIVDTSDERKSGATIELAHTYDSVATYSIKVMSVDETDAYSDWSTPYSIKITMPPPPFPPDTVKFVNIDTLYYKQTWFTFYTTVTQLIENDSTLYFKFSWGDGDTSGWILGQHPPRNPVLTLSHRFKVAGICTIKCWSADKIKDEYLSSQTYTSYLIPIRDNFVNKFEFPGEKIYGIAIDNGYIYVCDYYNGVIEKIDLNGNLIATIGEGILTCPYYIGLDDSFLYVTNADNSGFGGHNYKVYKFSKSTYRKIREWGSQGSGAGEFEFPSGICVDNEYVYVLDAFNLRVQKFDKNGNFIAYWSIPYESRGGMKIEKDTLYISSNVGNTILVYTSDGNFVRKIGTEGDGEGELITPYDVVPYSEYIYVVDTGNHRIQKFTKYGQFVLRWGSQGSEIGQFSNPYGIAIDEHGKIYVSDTGNERIQIFSETTKLP